MTISPSSSTIIVSGTDKTYFPFHGYLTSMSSGTLSQTQALMTIGSIHQFVYQFEFMSASNFIGLSTSGGNIPYTETYFGIALGSTSSNWQYIISGTSNPTGGAYSSFVLMPDTQSFASLWCPNFGSPVCALGMANSSTGASISLSSINYGGANDYV